MRWRIAIATLIIGSAVSYPAQAQTIGPSAPQIAGTIDESHRITFSGNTRPEANARNDRGPVAYNLPLEHIQMLLHRPETQERALDKLIDALHDRASPSFHKWLTPRDLGERFGVARQDIAKISAWLAKRGFTVNPLLPGRMLIDFSGTAGQVREAFHTEIHDLDVNGVHHIANMSDPRVPAALAPAIVGIVSLNDFRPKPQYTYTSPPCQPLVNGNPGSTCYSVVPSDLATIYNFNPAFAGGYTGKGQTVVVLESGDFYSYGSNPNDWSTFRGTFGLNNYASGSLTQDHPNEPTEPHNCADPLVGQFESEVATDAEWASAAAPDATIEIASCANAITPGVLIALENRTALQPVATISISYGNCEASNGALNQTFDEFYKAAAAQGFSIFVGAGDVGAASCDHRYLPQGIAAHGITVNGYASSPYVVAVGGTDFADTYLGMNSTYWNGPNPTDCGNLADNYCESAISYIPEIPWNDSCASPLLALYYTGSSTTYGAGGFCNIAPGQPFLNITAGGGGPSNCATGSGDSCAGWGKPSWQINFPGNPSDNVRDLPDVALFSGGLVWGHAYIVCYSDTNNGGNQCSGKPPSKWNRNGGTSFAAPIFAGIQALINQRTGKYWGNPNPTLYKIAAQQYSTYGPACYSTASGPNPACIFYEITEGGNDVPCSGSRDCFLDCVNGVCPMIGVLSSDDNSYAPAYSAGPNWNFAAGLGSLNVTNLINAFATQ